VPDQVRTEPHTVLEQLVVQGCWRVIKYPNPHMTPNLGHNLFLLGGALKCFLLVQTDLLLVWKYSTLTLFVEEILIL
jgi:hypothetical protein